MREAPIKPYEMYSVSFLLGRLAEYTHRHGDSLPTRWSATPLYKNRYAFSVAVHSNPLAEAVFRELLRNDDGVYRQCDKLYRRYPELFVPLHFLHWSTTRRGQVAYTPTTRYLVQDRQVVTTLGRYLTKHFGQLYKTHEIANIANEMISLEYGNDTDFKWCRTRDEIARAFESGPESCMGKSRSAFATGGIHPTEVYATDDIGVAILENQSQGIYARAVCNMKDKLYGRIYGNSTALRFVLDAKGFSYTDDCPVNGCRILRLESEHGLIGPYVDSGDSIYDTEDENYLIIGYRRGGSQVGSCTESHGERGHIHGVSRGYTCDACDSECDDIHFHAEGVGDVGDCCADEFVYVDGEDEYRRQCDCFFYEGNWYHEDDGVESEVHGCIIPESRATEITTASGGTDYVMPDQYEIVECYLSDTPTLNRYTKRYMKPNGFMEEILPCECEDIAWSDYYQAHVDTDVAQCIDGDWYYPADVPESTTEEA